MRTRLIDTIFLLNRECIIERNDLCKELNLSQTELILIDFLGVEERISCKKMAIRLNLSASRNSRLIDELVKKEILIRKEKYDNRKFKEISFTATGKKIKARLEKSKSNCEKKLMSQLNPEENDQLKKSIIIMQKIIKKQKNFIGDQNE